MNLTTNQFESNGYWCQPVAKLLYIPLPEDLALFDQNGYDLTLIEQHYAKSNLSYIKDHREYKYALKQNWFVQEQEIEGAVLNHSLLFERKGYTGAALAQLKQWARELPLINKIISIRPKWGLDFSMDYVDRQGNSFELLHWEWDSFNYDEIQEVKQTVEPKLLAIDWTAASKDLIKYKDKWHHLEFFEQSNWKCEYFGIPKERFKMVIWS